jgi:spermidine synthase
LTTSFGERIAEGFSNVFHGQLVHSERSAFQKIDVFSNAHFGRMLTLDDLVQTSERDEFCYHELLVHPALAARDPVERVLIIGGGDGGTLRHVLQHGVDEAIMCEIDEAVVRVSREFMPGLSEGAFDDARARLHIGDGAAFVRRFEDAFDAIIVDSTDPIGPAQVLVAEAFYRDCLRALRSDGVLVAQTGSPLYQTEELRTAVRNMAAVFPTVETYTGFVPTYPGVLWSFTAATPGPPVSSVTAAQVRSRIEAREFTPRLYTPELHSPLFALPRFIREICATAEASPVPHR